MSYTDPNQEAQALRAIETPELQPDNAAAPGGVETISDSEQVVRSAGVVSVAVMISRVAGLIREMVFANLFGAGFDYDAYMLGFRIPNLSRDLFAEGALSSAFVPTFTDYLATRSREDAARLANLVATMLIIVVGALCAAGMIFAPQLVYFLAPGFEEVPGKAELAVQMTRIMFPFLLLVALAAQAMGVLNACNRFGVPALSSFFFNIGSLVFGAIVGYWVGPYVGLAPIEGFAVGVVLGGALQLGVQIPSLRSLDFHFRPIFDFTDPGLARIVKLMVPAIIGNAAVQVNVMVNTNFASNIVDPVRGLDGSVSWLSYSFRFMHLPLGLFGVAMGAATLPAIARSAAKGNMDGFRRTLSDSLGKVYLMTFPSALGLILLGESIIGAVYQSGRFEAYDTHQTAVALSCFAVGLMGYAALRVLTPAFYALNDARTPMLVSILSIAVNYAAAATLIDGFGMGHAALALTTSVVAMFGFLILFLVIRSRIGGVHGRELLQKYLRVTVASIVMGGAVWLLDRQLTAWWGVSRLARVGDLAITIPAAIAVYYWACHRVGLPEIDGMLKSFVNPVLRRMKS